MKCPYCGNKAKLVKGTEIYCGFKNLADKWFWECLPCSAHVGCHGKTTNALGSLARIDLRQQRITAHHYFDRIWGAQRRSRKVAYQMLCRELDLPHTECHIAMFDMETCTKVIALCNAQIEIEKSNKVRADKAVYLEEKSDVNQRSV